jgi:hypothetical protein
MARIYYSHGSVPELQPLSRDERVRVLRMAGAAFGKTQAFRRSLWLLALLGFAAPIGLGLIGYFALQNVAAGVVVAVIAMQIGYSAWFHLRSTQLRPFIRQVLDGTITEEPPYHRAERWQDDPRYAIPQAGLFFGGFMGVAMWISDDRLPWWVILPLAFGSGLFFGTWMWFVHRLLKGR